MATYYYQLGDELTKAPYSGQESTQSLYGGQTVTQAFTLAGGSADTLEILLGEVPAGVRVSGMRYAISGAFTGAANLTATLTLRKKGSNAIGPVNGSLTQTGTTTTTPNRTIPLNGATLSVSANAQTNATLIPSKVEGLSPEKTTLQEPYYLALLLTSATGSTVVQAGITVFAALEGEFIGTP